MSEQVEPSAVYVSSQIRKKAEAAFEALKEESRDELLRQLKIAQVSIKPHGEYLINHVNQLGDIAADSGPSSIKFQAHLNLKRIELWTEKYHDESIMSGVILHYLRLKLAMLGAFCDDIRHEKLDPLPAHVKSLEDYWDNY